MRNITQLYAASPGPVAPTRFFCTVGLMSPTKPLQAVLNAIADANAAGMSASFLDLRNGTTDGVSAGVGHVLPTLDACYFSPLQCGGHPGPIGHFQLAQEAAPQVQAAMGW